MIDFIPNQKIVHINRERVVKGSTASGRLYLIAYQDNISAAMKDLSNSAFKIYIYFLFHKDGYSIAYSPEYLRKAANICKDTVRKAFHELQEKGYIIESDRGYEFYEYPKYSANIKPVGEQREFIDTDTGEIFRYSFDQLVSIVGKEAAVEMWGDNDA